MVMRSSRGRDDRPDREPSDHAPLFGNATRREFALGTIGGVAAALLTNCTDASDAAGPDAAPAAPPPPSTPAVDLAEDSAGVCRLYSQQTEGPFYLDLDLLRRNVKDDRTGTALALDLQVVNAACAPISNAVVDIWHADAIGLYSGYPRQGDGRDVDTTGLKFLRGTQVTGNDGRVQFETIYPGWYRGRTTHIHFKIHLSSSRVVTSQMYFPEPITAAVYGTGPYRARGQKDTSNARDRIARSGGGIPPLLAVTASGSGYTGTLAITVRNA